MTDIEQLVHERESLEDLYSSEGWRYFVRRCNQETKGAGYAARMATALNGDITDARVVHRTMIEVDRMLAWVPARIEELKGTVE